MGVLADFGSLLPHQVTWARRASLSDDGTPTYDAAQTFQARVDFKRSAFTNAQGQLVGTRGSIVVGGTPVIKPGDLLTLPDGSQPPILDASVVDDENGVPYTALVTIG